MRRAGKAFTLVELLVVVGIMGFMGAMSVGGYRAMRRGMEERSVLQNANQFFRTAYQRAVIDRVPVYVFTWNETLGDPGTGSAAAVVGKAVAVRIGGRITRVNGARIYDEFGDLQFDCSSRENDGDSDSAGTGASNVKAIYRISGSSANASDCRSFILQDSSNNTGGRESERISADEDVKYAEPFYFWTVKSGFNGWKVGDAYGFEFASLVLPRGYIFGNTYSRQKSSPVGGWKAFALAPDKSVSGLGAVYGLRPGSNGSIEPHKAGSIQDPSKDRDYDVKDLRK
ncbi:MAG: type II secretion system protein [Kiritimatiellae bacterium]|nr:type II secretion system protein [Kiritimatiellia bacterium]